MRTTHAVMAGVALLLLAGCGDDGKATTDLSSGAVAEQIVAETARAVEITIARDRDIPESATFQGRFDERLASLDSLEATCVTPTAATPSKLSCTIVGDVTLVDVTSRFGGDYDVQIRPADECWDATADPEPNAIIFFHYERLSTCNQLTADQISPLDDSEEESATPDEPVTAEESPPEADDPAVQSDQASAPASLDRAPSRQTIDECVGDFTQRETETERTRSFLSGVPGGSAGKAYGWLEFFAVGGPCRVVIAVSERSLTFDQQPEGGWSEGYERDADNAQSVRPAQAFSPGLDVTDDRNIISLAAPSGP